ncbi:hypothetical protein C2845_PM01G34420 [Panicum miliaceum]|uniref:Uncharacterized protein n=1 Tax=Panicum miliaceum TaxID=4540 RepID=A0A3L6TJB7_PANMI|nr:hypothetical protein C2845_PM01G34420 [Panicum miliaceum]
MDRASVRRIAVATALHLLAALHGAGPCAAAARPLEGRLPAGTTSALALAPAAAHLTSAAADDDAAAREGKWLPFAGAHHLPPAYWAHKPVPSWVGLGAGAGELGAGAAERAEGEEEEEAARDGERRRRQRPSYAGDGASTRQERLAMWASLLNPKRRGRGRGSARRPTTSRPSRRQTPLSSKGRRGMKCRPARATGGTTATDEDGAGWLGTLLLR